MLRICIAALLTSAVVGAAPSGNYHGSVPFIIDITADITSATLADFDINIKIAKQEVKCAGETIAVSDTAVTFPNIAATGDCMGDALRGQNKDVTKYSLTINSDDTLTFHSDGYPDMKLSKASVAAAAAPSTWTRDKPSPLMSDSYVEKAVPGGQLNCHSVAPNATNTWCNAVCNKAMPECSAACKCSPGLPPPAPRSTFCSHHFYSRYGCDGGEDSCCYEACADGKFGRSGYDSGACPADYSVNGGGNTTALYKYSYYQCPESHSADIRTCPLTILEVTWVEKAKKEGTWQSLVSKYHGSVPFIVDITADITSATLADFDTNIKIAKQEDMKLSKASAAAAAAPSGNYHGSVPFIIDITADITSATLADFDINIKIAKQEVKCAGETIAIGDTAVTFPNITTTGDCMGDALRGQNKDVTKYSLSINSDGTLTFHSDGYPDMKLTNAAVATTIII